MTEFQFSIPTKVNRDDAIRRILSFAADTKKKVDGKLAGFRMEWIGNLLKFNFTFDGFPVSGVLTVGDQNLEISLDLPLMAMFLKKKIRSAFTQRVESVLSAE